MNARVKSAEEKSDGSLVIRSCIASTMTLCLALIQKFGFAPNGRCAKFAELLHDVYRKYDSECKATRYETKIRVMCIKIQYDVEKETGFKYKLRERRNEDSDAQDFLFMASVLTLYRHFGFHGHGKIASEASADVRKLLDEYNRISVQWNNFNRDMKKDMLHHPGHEKEYKVNLFDWSADRLRSYGMEENVLNEKILGW